MTDTNPGPWWDDEGLWFEVGPTTYGPYEDEDAAELDLDRVLRGLPPMTEDEWARQTLASERP